MCLTQEHKHQDLGPSRPGESVLQLPLDAGWYKVLLIFKSYNRTYSAQPKMNLHKIICDSRLQIQDFSWQTKEALRLLTDI